MVDFFIIEEKGRAHSRPALERTHKKNYDLVNSSLHRNAFFAQKWLDVFFHFRRYINYVIYATIRNIGATIASLSVVTIWCNVAKEAEASIIAVTSFSSSCA